MSRNKNIDELFRDGLNDKGLEFRESYWDQMESLMDTRKKRSWKVIIWIMVSLLILGGSYWTFFRVQEDQLPLAQNEASSKPSYASISSPDSHEAFSASLQQTSDSTPNEFTSTPLAKPAAAKKSTSFETKKPTKKDNDILSGSIQSLNNKLLTDLKPDESLMSSALNSKMEPSPEVMLIKSKQIIQIPLIQASRFQYDFPNPMDPSTILNGKNENKNNRPPLFHYSLAAYYEIGWVDNRYDPNIASWKKAHEKSQAFRQQGIQLSITKGRLSLLTGFGTRQWSSLTNYTHLETTYELDSTLRLINRNFIKRPDGSFVAQVQYQYDTLSSKQNAIAVCPDCRVNFHYITLPLMLQYEWDHSRIFYSAGAGMDFSFFNGVSGTYSAYWTQENTGPDWKTLRSPSSYFSKTIMQARLNLGIGYQINSKMSLKSALVYRYTLNSMMTRYSQKPNFYSMSLGLEWRIR
ncbi:MAG: hypothetical protein GC180_00345 [Bacteroidetes bacterium]|nr:hypothetical protein [Bacteroidota bacterium]